MLISRSNAPKIFIYRCTLRMNFFAYFIRIRVLLKYTRHYHNSFHLNLRNLLYADFMPNKFNSKSYFYRKCAKIILFCNSNKITYSKCFVPCDRLRFCKLFSLIFCLDYKYSWIIWFIMRYCCLSIHPPIQSLDCIDIFHIYFLVF